MSSEQLADGVNPLDAELAATWDVLKGYSGRDTDLGIARRFGGAAAAYSLRNIGSDGLPVVRVRREPNDTDAAINDEENFSANQVQDGTLERWVNGELESTLPADVATAAAAYSLRKVKSDYSGDAVRIRRSSDDIEVDVAFDSDDKVSASSAITNVAEQGGESGQTTATDLNEFLNPTYTVGTSVESATRPFDSFTSNGNDGFTATNDTIGSATAGFPYTFATGDVISVSFDLVIENSASPTFILSGNDMGSGSLGTGTTFTTSGSYTQEITTTSGTGTHLAFTDGNTGTFTVSNFRVTSHKAEAFVHTWYDQAGSNDAVQETAANQPKIAENGALLADGLLFDDSNDFLQSSTQVLTGTTNNSIYCVVKTLSDNGYIAGSAGTGVGMSIYAGTTKFILSNNNTASTTTQDTIPMVNDKTVLVSANFDDGTTDSLHLNANANGYANGSSAYSITAGTKFTIGARDGSTAEAVMYKGSIQEIIAYDSFQGANRFKIESNINNYYSLYNDANDTSGVFAESSLSGGTFENATNDGFDCTTGVNNQVFVNIDLALDGVANDSSYKYYISFNADVDYNGGSTALVALTNDSGSVATTAYTVDNGFNFRTLTANQAGVTPQKIRFQIRNTAGVTKTVNISDFKVSRIARDGFVETWYDQSGSGNDATQGTADRQPSIVKNGGICTSNSSPSVFFTGDTRDDKLNFTDLTLTDAIIFTVVNIDSSADQQIILGGGLTSTATGVMMPIIDDGSSTTQVYKNSTVGGAEQGSSQFKNGAQITLADRDDAFDNLAVDSQILFTMVDVDVAEAKVLNGISRPPSDALSFHMQGQMNELIIYNSDLSSDRGTIESEIANHYNITLS
jgi:hypothetical protein